MRRISKSYQGVRALREASLDVRAGEVHALLGENGAGKSTLIKILAGAVARDQGDILLAGEAAEIGSRQEAQRLGIGVVFQHPELVDELTIADNVTLGAERSRAGMIRRRDARERTAAALRRLGVELSPERAAAGLRTGERQLVEIARAMVSDVRILVLDEPTASLGRREVANLFAVVRELREQGVGIIYISHRLEEIESIADRVTVLRDGAVVATVGARTTSRGELVRMMVGREMGHAFRKESHVREAVALEAVGLSTDAGLDGVSLTLRQGEVLGVYGLLGSGRTELARALAGADRLAAGQVRLTGRPLRLRSPSRAARHGIGLVPEDRTGQGLFPILSVRENVTLSGATRSRTASSGGPRRHAGLSRPSASSRSGRRRPKRPSPRSPAATSRRSCSAAGSSPARGC
jgi:ABC-type sugar transport system ATPase subunit